LKKNRVVAIATASLVGAAMLPLAAGQVSAAPGSAPGASFADSSRDEANRGHVLNTPAWAEKAEAERLVALEQRLKTGGSGTAERIAKNTYGRVATTGEEKIFVVLAEFGDVTHPGVPDDPEQSDATTFDGPMHNDIPTTCPRRR
jgi:immune inhibitor A